MQSGCISPLKIEEQWGNYPGTRVIDSNSTDSPVRWGSVKLHWLQMDPSTGTREFHANLHRNFQRSHLPFLIPSVPSPPLCF